MAQGRVLDLNIIITPNTKHQTSNFSFYQINYFSEIVRLFGLNRITYKIERMKKLLRVLVVICFTASMAISQKTDRIKSYNVSKGLAIEGYDAVAYFKLNKAVKGKEDFAVKDKGVLYYFSSKANKDEFFKNASKFEPQYGGWCAYAMGASGEKVEIDPETFKIVDGKLYLFYHSFTNNTLNTWNKDEAGLKFKADKNWDKIN